MDKDLEIIRMKIVKTEFRLLSLEEKIDGLNRKMDPLEEEIKKFRLAIKVATVLSTVITLGAGLFKLISVSPSLFSMFNS